MIAALLHTRAHRQLGSLSGMTRECSLLSHVLTSPICATDARRSALLRHEARVQRLETRVDGRTHDDAKAQVLSRPLALLHSTFDPSRPPVLLSAS